MTEQEIIKGLTYLGVSYGKTFTPQECQIYHDFLKDYSYETFVTAIKNIIKTSKFLPKITELIEACEGAKIQTRFDVIEYMNQIGYFKHPREYEKATLFMERGIVPEWLQNDINTYYKMMVNNRLESHEQKLLG